jgi:hypothetical protein
MRGALSIFIIGLLLAAFVVLTVRQSVAQIF